MIFVLSQAHRDPHIRGLKKLECFGEKAFEGLKRLFKEVIFKRTGSRVVSSSVSERRKKVRKWKDKTRYSEHALGALASISIIGREKIWWDKERWDEMHDLENPWGDLSIEQEMRLKKMIKGIL